MVMSTFDFLLTGEQFNVNDLNDIAPKSVFTQKVVDCFGVGSVVTIVNVNTDTCDITIRCGDKQETIHFDIKQAPWIALLHACNKLKCTKEKADIVKHPSHYTSGKIEVWDFIIDQKLNYCLGNAIKYIARAGKKNPNTYIEDLKKAIQYLEKEISVYDLLE